jgi:hypothetical protein
MNRDHLGDAYDYWKRAMLDVLRKSGRTLKILPMFTDDKEWKEPEISVYKTLLGAGTHEIELTKKFARSKGSSPFADAKNAGKWSDYDLFLDPDTGVENKSNESGNKRKEPRSKRKEPGNKSPKPTRHLKHSELAHLLGKTNVVAVYQHAPREGNGWLKKKLEDLRKDLRKDKTPSKDHIETVGYEAGRVGMIFATKARKRSFAMWERLRKLAGPTAKGRVFPSRKKRPS